MLFVKHLCSKTFHKIMTQIAETYVTPWKSLGHATWFISLGWNSLLLFFRRFASIILLWHGLKFWPIQGKGLLFQVYHCLSLLSKHIYFWKIWWPSGLRCCDQYRKVPDPNPTRSSARLRDPTSFRGSRWPSGWICKTQVINIGWVRLPPQ